MMVPKTCLERLVAVQVTVEDMDIASVDVGCHLGFNGFDGTNQPNNGIGWVG